MQIDLKTTKPFIFGIAGTKLSKAEIDLFQNNPCVGFILFSRNIESRSQVQELTDSLKGLYADRKPLIFIDQEGGRVARIKPPIAKEKYPTAGHFADMYQIDPKQAKQAVYDNYQKLMLELKELGIDSPCAPCCDLLHPDGHDIIGDRSFGRDVDQVVELCQAAIDGINSANGMPWVKHIPGHGKANLDSHFDLPIIDTDLNEMEKTDFQIFSRLSERNKSDKQSNDRSLLGMSAHIIYSAIDPKIPATLSTKVIDYIRKNIGFNGILVTDDINMLSLHGEIGRKLSVLHKIIKAANQQQEIDILLMQNYKNYFQQSLENLSFTQIIQICQACLDELKPQYRDSLKNVAKLSLEAGCDIVLHCSGDLEEMQEICNIKI